MKTLFLDLEQTVIVDFEKFNPCNIKKVRKFIEHEAPNHIQIFSFAIWDKSDVEKTRKSIIPMLENLLDCIISTRILTITDMREIVQKKHNLFFDTDFEFTQLNGKFGAFQKIASLRKDDEVILLDDMVENTTTMFHDRGIKLRTINVNRL